MKGPPKVWRAEMSDLLSSDATERSGQEENLRRLLASKAAKFFLRIGNDYHLCYAKTVAAHPQFPDARQLTLTLEIREEACH